MKILELAYKKAHQDDGSHSAICSAFMYAYEECEKGNTFTSEKDLLQMANIIL